MKLRPAALALILCALIAAAAILSPYSSHSDESPDLSVTVEGYSVPYANTTFVVWVIWAENHGSRDAHGVDVLVDQVNPVTGKLYYKFSDYADSTYSTISSLVKDQNNLHHVEIGSGRRVWRIGTLNAGSQIGIGIVPEYEWTGDSADEPDRTTGSNSGRIVAPLSVEIFTHHRDPFPENNRVTTEMLIKKGQVSHSARSAFNTLLEAQADNLRPANKNGQAVDFTLKMENLAGRGLDTSIAALLSDVKLDITLSGLKVKTAPTTNELNGATFQCKHSGTANDTLGTCTDGDDYAEWGIGFLYDQDGTEDCTDTDNTGKYDCRQLTLKLSLDGDSYDDGKEIPLAERCLEARLRSLPPPNPGDWRGGPLKVCLGADDPPRLLLEDGQVDLFTLYPCVGTGRDAYPCNSDDTDSLEVVAGAYLPLDFTRRSDILGDPAGSVHARNRNSGKAVIQASDNDLFIQVKDPGGRYFDGQTIAGSPGIGSSVNSGSVISWHTARNSFYATPDTSTNYRYNKAANLPGAHLAFTAAPFSGERSDWDKMAILTGVGGLKDDGSLPPAYTPTTCPDPVSSALPTTGLPTLPLTPGDARKRQMWLGVADADHITSYANYPWYKRHNQSYLTTTRNIRPYDRFFEFEKLGTYVVYYHVSGKRSSTATLKPGQTFCDTARYVFHVGPVAELELQEGGGAPSAGVGQHGYSVVVRNHGPDAAENAEVNLGVTGANASVSRGCFNPSTGVWSLSGEWNETGRVCDDRPYTRLPDEEDHRFHPGDEATITFVANTSPVTAEIYNREQCVNAAGVVQPETTEISCIYDTTQTTPTRRTDTNNDEYHWGSYQVCVDYDSSNTDRANDYIRVVSNKREPVTNQNQCKLTANQGKASNTYDVGTVYDYDERNNRVALRGRAGPRPAPAPTPVPEEPVTYPPRFEDGDSATRQVPENSPSGTEIGEPLTAKDPQVARVNYALEGEHAGLFRVGQWTGQLTLAEGAGLDYETQAEYAVNVVARNGLGNRKTLPVTVQVVNVPEQGSVSISPPGVPTAGEELAATLAHEDGEPLEPLWQWQRSDGASRWRDIADATGPTYTPGELDAGRRLRVLAIYGNPPVDGFPDTGVSLAGAVTPTLAGDPVALPAPPPDTELPAVAQPYDRNGDGAISRDEALAALADYFAGNLTRDEATGIVLLYFATGA